MTSRVGWVVCVVALAAACDEQADDASADSEDALASDTRAVDTAVAEDAGDTRDVATSDATVADTDVVETVADTDVVDTIDGTRDVATIDATAVDTAVDTVDDPGVTLSVVTTRERCVAPCAIFFDATTSTLPSADPVGATFTWDFDATGVDPDAAHRGRGFVVAHAFRVPGVYAVDAEVHDQDGRRAATRVVVTIDDPAGPTLFVSHDGRADGSGSEADPLDSLAAALARVMPGTRVLMRRGDVFDLGAIVATGDDVTLGAYVDPDAPALASPELRFATTGVAVELAGTSDWRFVDLHLVANAAHTGFSAAGSTRTLILGVELEGVRQAQALGVYVTNSRELALVDSHLHDFDRYGVYGGADHLALVGNRFERFGGNEHGVRVTAGDVVYVAKNDVRGADTKTAFTFRGNGWGTTLTRVVFVDNVAGDPVTFTPQNFEQDERVSDVLVDGNRFLSWVSVTAQHVAVRNNLFFDAGLTIDTRHPLLPSDFVRDIRIENNTVRFATHDFETSFLIVFDLARDIAVRNNLYASETTVSHSRFLNAFGPLSAVTVTDNLVYMPNVTNPQPFWIGGAGYSASAWSAVTGGRVIVADPGFVSVDREAPDALRPEATGPAIDAAESGFSYTDRLGAPRPVDGDDDGVAGWDLGAYEVTP